MDVTDPTRMTATELDAAFQIGATSPRKACEAILARIGRLDPSIKAFATLDIEGALLQADAATHRRASGRALSALDGVPVSIKDNLFVAGQRATWGSLLFKDHVPARDDIAIERLRAAGAVILGKTNTPELAMASITENRIFGRTRNPWRLDLTPGGSSGGAAAQLAALMGPLALTTDAGGSTRRPASFCGIVGLKPTIGAVPRAFGFPALADDFQVIGAMARTVEDVTALFDVVAGPDRRDHASLTVHSSLRRKNHGEPSRKVLLASRLGGAPVDADCVRAAERAAAALAGNGYVVEEAHQLWDIEEIETIFSTLVRVGVARVVSLSPGWREAVTPPIASMAVAGQSISASDYVKALDRVAELRRDFAVRLEEFDAIVTPTAASTAWSADLPAPTKIDGVQVAASAGRIFATAVNLLGLPAISLPAHAGKDGLPVGAQIIGGWGEDHLILEMAALIELSLALVFTCPIEPS